MEIERSFKYAVKAQGAGKGLALGGLFSFLFFTVFFAFIAVGYLMRVLIDSLEGRDAYLPKWDRLGVLFQEGIQPVLLFLAFYSPLLVLFVLENLLVSTTGVNGFAVLTIFLVMRLVLLLLISILAPLALMHFVIKRSLAAAFDFRALFGFIKKNAGTYFTAWGLSALIQLGVTALLLLPAIVLVVLGYAMHLISMSVALPIAAFLLVLFFFGNFLVGVISFHLYGQAYRASTPFEDDADGEIRSSMAMPPPLRGTSPGRTD